MPVDGGFQCTVITPERRLFDAPADFVAMPAHDGEIGILRDRAPLVCKLGIGILRIQTGGDTHRIFVDGGFARMLENTLVILTPQARTPKEIDPAAEEAALSRARGLHPTDAEGQAARRRDIDRAAARLRLAR